MDFKTWVRTWANVLQSDNLDLQANYTEDTYEAGVWVVLRGVEVECATVDKVYG